MTFAEFLLSHIFGIIATVSMAAVVAVAIRVYLEEVRYHSQNDRKRK